MTNRRSFLAAAAGGAFWLQARGQDGPPRAAKRDMIVRSVRPQDLEMPISGFSDYITPAEHFFVRTHVYAPEVRLSQWRLKVEGEVSSPLTLTMEDLRALPAVEVTSVLECAGNGRSFYNPTVAGIQWTNGAAGNGRWRGARLADVLRKAGVKANAAHILFDGADAPLGEMADFRRTIPIRKALDANTLLAYELNGEALPVQHGYPLRAVAPGWAGDSWVKWVVGIGVLDKESDGWWMKNAYRHPGKPVAPGSAMAQEAMRPLESLRVKSVIATPADGSQIEAGKPAAIRGVAWSGEGGPVVNVDVSVDGGRSWRAARLISPATRYGWRQWEFGWTPPAEGYYTVLARARDLSGDSQPLVQEWNPSGYLWNVAARAGVTAVGRNAPQPSQTAAGASPSAAPEPLKAHCEVCHELDVIQQQRLTRAQWDRELNKMSGWMPANRPLSQAERQTILDYLSSNFGPRP
ncbi:MAG TPA: sulfite oxidase [Bryobacteraceae bacterium]|nr:sulfite oxidase [Bryobacteraceae bacterium]